MDVKLLDSLPKHWLNALGNTLLHSLWMGLVLAILAGFVMFVTMKSSAKLRYNLLTICLLSFVIAVSSVFYSAVNQLPTGMSIRIADEVAVKLIEVRSHQDAVSQVRFDFFTAISKLFKLWDDYSYQIILIWFLVIFGKGIQLLLGLKGIFHLRHHQVYAAGKIWDEHLVTLSNKLGLKQEVKMVQSGIAKVPLVIGHFKPLILIPLGLLNGLSTIEVEAILAHELAHIKRRDYLVNLLQSFIEIIFFFNPAVLWVSKLIKTEREHCCDDLAIACISDRKNYVKALIFCQEFMQGAPAFAMGITGKKGSLMQRASRMLFKTNSTLNNMEKTILTIALVASVICTAAIKSVSVAATASNKTASVSALQDTARRNKSAEQIEKEIEQKMKVAEKKAADKKQLGEKRSKRKSTPLQIQDDYEEIARQANRDAKQAVVDARQAVIDAEQARKDAAQAVIDAEIEEKDSRQAIIDSKQAAIDAKQAAADSKSFQKSAKIANMPKPPRPARAPGISALGTPPNPPSAGGYAVPVNLPKPPVLSSLRQNNQITRTTLKGTYTSKTVTDGQDYTAQINQQLLKDGLVTGIKNLSYKLNKSEMIINGVKQNQEIHQKYQQKYLKNKNHSLMYNFRVEHSND